MPPLFVPPECIFTINVMKTYLQWWRQCHGVQCTPNVSRVLAPKAQRDDYRQNAGRFKERDNLLLGRFEEGENLQSNPFCQNAGRFKEG